MKGIGIIGCGKIAQIRHIPEFEDNPHSKVTALYDINLKRASLLAKKTGAVAYDSLEGLLADPSVDAVCISVANADHCDVTVKSLLAGKDVLCEKPMATSLEECLKMITTAEECGKKLMIAQNQRLAQAHVEARRLVAEGAIGEVLSFRTSFGHSGPENWSVDPGKDTWFFDKSQAAMGVMADLGVHKTDLIQYILGQDVVAVSAKLATLHKTGVDDSLIGVEDNALCIYEMSGGAIGTMTASWTYYGAEDNSTVIYGTKGSLTIYEIDRAPIVLRKTDGSVENFDLERIQTNADQNKSGIADAFVDCLVNDTEPLISGRGVLNAMKAVFAAIESSSEGKRIEIR